MKGMDYELANVKSIDQIFAAGAPFLPVTTSAMPRLVLPDTTPGTNAWDLDWEKRAMLVKALRCSRAAQREESNGFKYTAAIKWRTAAELFAPYARAVEYCWCKWERIMQLPRQLAGPVGAGPTLVRVI